MYEGIEEEIEFSGSQLVGQKLAALYMKVVASLQNFEKELPKNKNMWTPAQQKRKVEMIELVEHYLSMPIILELNILIEDLQRQKKGQKQKTVTFWEQEHQQLPSTSRDTILDLPLLSPWTVNPTKTTTSAYQNTGGQGGANPTSQRTTPKCNQLARRPVPEKRGSWGLR